MKTILKIIIPLICIFALIIGLVWFFLQYRPDLTASFLTSRAQSAEEHGRYDRAVRYYSYAWKLSPQDDTIAIALADAYKRADNYTKAEYTLVSAITANPEDLNLYLALAKTYVEQDKLLDCVQMLDYTANDTIREQLNQLRPSAPELTPESGYYNERISVSATALSGTVYLTVDGEFPSLEEDLYTDTVDLEPGVTTVLAVAVSEDGLVSPVATTGYTISGVVEEITISDPGLDACIRTALGKSENETLMTNELWSIQELELTSDVTDVSELSNLTSLTSLTAHGLYGIDFSCLNQLTRLTHLDLSGCTISSASLEAIASLTNLTSLNLEGCSIRDIRPLSSLVNLQTLNLSDNAFTDISALGSLVSLQKLSLSGNALLGITPLATCTQLEELDLSGCQLTGISALTSTTALKVLDLSNNALTDISALQNCTQLTTVDLSENQLTSIDALTQITSITTLDVSHNAVTEVSDFSSESSLQKIVLSYNSLTSVSFLEGLEQLNYVDLDYNSVSDLSVLAQCRNLVQVNAFQNPVTDVTALKEHNIIVNYDPTYSES